MASQPEQPQRQHPSLPRFTILGRPLALAIIVVLHIFLAFSFLFFGGFLLYSAIATYVATEFLLLMFTALIAGVLIIMGAVSITLGIYLWLRRPWAYAVDVLLTILFLLSNLALQLERGDSRMMQFIIGILTLALLFLPSVRSIFQSSQPQQKI
jgi:hypothetical protein